VPGFVEAPSVIARRDLRKTRRPAPRIDPSCRPRGLAADR